MKVTIRTLQTAKKGPFEVDIEATSTVLQVKEKIESTTEGEYEAKNMKLVHAGKKEIITNYRLLAIWHSLTLILIAKI
jgi:hypothetical protein